MTKLSQKVINRPKDIVIHSFPIYHRIDNRQEGFAEGEQAYRAFTLSKGEPYHNAR